MLTDQSQNQSQNPADLITSPQINGGNFTLICQVTLFISFCKNSSTAATRCNDTWRKFRAKKVSNHACVIWYRIIAPYYPVYQVMYYQRSKKKTRGNPMIKFTIMFLSFKNWKVNTLPSKKYANWAKLTEQNKYIFLSFCMIDTRNKPNISHLRYTFLYLVHFGI